MFVIVYTIGTEGMHQEALDAYFAEKETELKANFPGYKIQFMYDNYTQNDSFEVLNLWPPYPLPVYSPPLSTGPSFYSATTGTTPTYAVGT
jgi:hypothetical protein